MSGPSFSQTFEPAHGEAIRVDPDLPIWRVTAENPGPFTFRGTNTYLLGDREVTLVDPGPLLESHREALERALVGRTIAQIVITHTHVDHSPLGVALARDWQVPILGCTAHFAARELALGEVNPLDASADRDYRPDTTLSDGDGIATECGTLTVIETPGHTANHLCFALDDAGIVLSGDHVMAWSTSIVAPPDGSMRDYMASLDRLLERDDRCYLPGHGGPVEAPQRFVRGLRAHRRMRSTAIRSRLAAGDRTIPEIVRAIYTDVDPRLHGAAGLSVFAHLEEMVARGEVGCDGEPLLTSRYSLL